MVHSVNGTEVGLGSAHVSQVLAPQKACQLRCRQERLPLCNAEPNKCIKHAAVRLPGCRSQAGCHSCCQGRAQLQIWLLTSSAVLLQQEIMQKGHKHSRRGTLLHQGVPGRACCRLLLLSPAGQLCSMRMAMIVHRLLGKRA